MKISELLDSIKKRDLVLPEFQREYVWTKEQAKQLMVSLFKGYPVGSLLVWKTDQPPELKNVEKLPEKFGTTMVILDGQQRLTTLFLLIKGDIPPYYTEKDINADPRDLYFNIDNGEFQYYQSTRMKDNPLWQKVIDCFCQNINFYKIAQDNSDGNSDVAFGLAQKYNNNLNSLRNIVNIDLPLQSVPPSASLGDAIDIFDRVNSQGTKLTDAELALTHVTGKWPNARKAMKAKIEEMNIKGFDFDLNFLMRALTVLVTKRALFTTIHNASRTELETGWQKLKKILDYLVTVLPARAFIHSTNDLNTTNVLIPIISYLSLNDGKFKSEKSLKNALYWLYSAHTWARYSSQTDQRIEYDVSITGQEQDSPWKSLCDQIIDQRGRIEVKANDLQGRGVQHPLYRMTLITAKALGALDWFNGVPLGYVHGQAYHIHSHHIFPHSILYKNKYDKENHLHRKIVNEIANYAFLTAESNLSLSAKLPEEYLPEVEERYPGALAKQFIPMHPELWKLDRFPEFLDARRELIAQKINEFMLSLIAEPEQVKTKSVLELIKMGESANIEFKSTLQWDLIQNRINKNLRHAVLRTIAAFLNSNGGILILGVEDDGTILGIENDLRSINGNTDSFYQLLMNLISEYIGPQYSPFIKIRFETIEDKQVCVIESEKSSTPVYLKSDQGKEFHIRMGNTNRKLDTEEAINYKAINWE